jgi:hypothetical protein
MTKRAVAASRSVLLRIVIMKNVYSFVFIAKAIEKIED